MSASASLESGSAGRAQAAPWRRLLLPARLLLAGIVAALAVMAGTSGASAQSAVTIVTTSLPDGTVGTPYSFAVETTGPFVRNDFWIETGALPPGVTLGPTTGVISGTPTVTGTFAFTLGADGPDMDEAYADLAITIRAAAAGTSITIRQVVTGSDRTFAFSSSTSALNLGIATAGGVGSQSVTVEPGTHKVVAADLAAAGVVLVGLGCDDEDSSGDVAARAATIVVSAGEAVVCTFVSVAAGEVSQNLIDEFLAARAGLILLNQPDLQRRIDRLNGVTTAGTGIAGLMAMMPAVEHGGPVTVRASAAGFPPRGGGEQRRFDVWFEARYQGVQIAPNAGAFAMGTLGADYLVTPRLLAGAFVSVDNLGLARTAGPGAVSGTGWLLGGYVTGKATPHLYLDALLAGGTSWNVISPTGTYTDAFTSARALASAALHGDWTFGRWNLAPRARLAYFMETTSPYTDSLGAAIPSVTTGLLELAAGPLVSYRHETGGGAAVVPALRLDVASRWRSSSVSGASSALLGRVEPQLDIRLPGGAAFGIAGIYEFGAGHQVYGGRIRIAFGWD